MKQHAAIVLVVCIALTAFAQEKRGPSTPEERAKAVQIAKALENDPVAATIYPERQWLIRWVIEVPDISVEMCTAIVPTERKYKFSSDLMAVSIGAMATNVIEHPEAAKDPVVTGQVGLEAVLRAYTKLMETHPKDRSKKLDEWMERQKDGTLPEAFKKAWNDTCKSAK